MSDRSGPDDRLTICSASYRSKACLELSWELTARLNPSKDFTWLVVENTDDPAQDRLGPSDDRFHVLSGVPAARTGRTRGSYQHGASLNSALEQVASRFVLFLDPDFFLVRPGWIGTALDHMQAQGLSFFGAPYHPGRHTKYRYFPCVSCLFVDLRHVDKRDLDFMPELDEMQALASLGAGQLARWWVSGLPPASLAAWPALPRGAALSLIPGNVARRALAGRALWPFVGTSRDVGYRIYRRFRRSSRHRAGWATPVWREAPGTRTPNAAPPARLAQWLDGLLVMPRRPGYFSRTGFRELGAWDVAGAGWEEFLWRGEPFGFHVQGLSQGLKPAQTLGEAVEAFLNPGCLRMAGARPEAGPTTAWAGRRQAVP